LVLAYRCIVAVTFDLAIAQADDAIGVFKQPRVVRGKDECEAQALVEAMHQVDKLCGVVRVKICGRFVSQHQRGPMDDGASNGDALAFAP
jgi:hypothetical protein